MKNGKTSEQAVSSYVCFGNRLNRESGWKNGCRLVSAAGSALSKTLFYPCFYGGYDASCKQGIGTAWLNGRDVTPNELCT